MQHNQKICYGICSEELEHKLNLDRQECLAKAERTKNVMIADIQVIQQYTNDSMMKAG